MLIELVQMALALSLLGVGLLLFSITQLARRGVVLRLALPVWTRWAVSVVFLMVLLAACQPMLPH
ncbi:MAG: hypothetical protein R3E79_60960 [Caldilineaceae bacterium]